MLIPTAYQRLPADNGCHNGRVIMGGTVSQMAAGLAQLSNAKILGEAHYPVSHSLYGRNGFGSSVGGAIDLETLPGYKVKKYHFLYQSTPLSERLAISFLYTASTIDDTPEVVIRLRPTTGSSYSATAIDNGIKFSNEIHIAAPGIIDGAVARSLFTGCELIDAPSNTLPDLPRPLYVPSANRGQLLNIEFELSGVALGAVHIYDIFEAEVTP